MDIQIFQNKRILFIGNSDKERQYVNDVDIKKYSCIIGFNHIQHKIQKYNVIVHNMNVNSYNWQFLNYLKENNITMLSRFDLYNDTHPDNINRKRYFDVVNKNINLKLECIPLETEELIRTEYNEKFKGQLTTGFIATIYFLQYLNCFIDIVGFDFYRKFYSGENALPTAIEHDSINEFNLFKKIIIPKYSDRIKFIGSVERYMYDKNNSRSWV